MSIVVVGSVAFDSLETPAGKREQALGGSANYFSIASSMLTDVKLCAVVGDDFPPAHVAWLKKRGIDVDGLIHKAGKTFHWKGRYGLDLNVFADFDPILPASYLDARTVFLANIDPDLQRKVVGQVKGPKLIGMDSMNLWINIKRDSLIQTLQLVDILFLNEGETRLLSGEHNIVKAARAVQKLSKKPLTVVVKRGEYGALLFRPDSVVPSGRASGDGIMFVPAFAVEDVFDPTGAGDTFAGGCMGALDRTLQKGEPIDDNAWRRALLTGTVMASFVVEDFSFDRMMKLTAQEIRDRAAQLRAMTTADASVDV